MASRTGDKSVTSKTKRTMVVSRPPNRSSRKRITSRARRLQATSMRSLSLARKEKIDKEETVVNGRLKSVRNYISFAPSILEMKFCYGEWF